MKRFVQKKKIRKNLKRIENYYKNQLIYQGVNNHKLMCSKFKRKMKIWKENYK